MKNETSRPQANAVRWSANKRNFTIDLPERIPPGYYGWFAVGEYDWWALYQGVPRPKEGQLFPGEPVYFSLDEHRWDGTWRAVIVLDPAASESTSADYSAIGLFAMRGYGSDSVMRVLRVQRFQMGIPDVAAVALAWQQKYRVLLAVEAVGAFVGVPQTIRKSAPGLRIFEIKRGPTLNGVVVFLGDKFTRAQPASGAWKDPRGARTPRTRGAWCALPWPDAAFVVLMLAVAAWAVVGTTVGWIIQTLRSVS